MLCQTRREVQKGGGRLRRVDQERFSGKKVQSWTFVLFALIFLKYKETVGVAPYG